MSTQAEAKGQTTAAVSAEVAVQRWTQGAIARTTDLVGEEMPVALVYHDVPHVVMLNDNFHIPAKTTLSKAGYPLAC